MITSHLHRVWYLIFVALLALSVLSCGFLLSSDDDAWLNIENSTSSLSTGQSYTFALYMRDNSGEKQNVTSQASWTSSSTSIAEFTNDGVIFTKTSGTVALGAEYNGLYTSIVLNVTGSGGTTKNPGDVYCIPENISVSPDVEFVTEIHVNTAVQKLGSYSFRIPFDQWALSFVRFDIVATEYNFSPYVGSNEIVVYGGMTAGQGVGPITDLVLLKVFWKANNPGYVFPLTLPIEDVQLTNENGIQFPEQNGYFCNVTINGTPTMEPTPMPSPEPQKISIEMGPAGSPVYMNPYTTYEFGSVPADGPTGMIGAPVQVTIFNTGSTVLTINYFGLDTSNFLVDYMGYYPLFTIPAFSSITFMIQFNPMYTGEINTPFDVISDDPVYPTHTIYLHGTGEIL